MEDCLEILGSLPLLLESLGTRMIGKASRFVPWVLDCWKYYKELPPCFILTVHLNDESFVQMAKAKVTVDINPGVSISNAEKSNNAIANENSKRVIITVFISSIFSIAD
jgi:hypothetical protein